MEPLDFLAGKYQQATQILSGPLQAFRAVDAATGRDVFVHRVAASDPVAHQVALLLSSALLRSAKARRLVLDVVEEDGFAYVVTDTEHQCLLLREWLQLEINQASGGDAGPRKPASAADTPASAEAAPKPNGAPAPPVEPAQKSAPKDEPGEFTRLFMAGMSSPAAPSPKPVDPDVTRAMPAAKVEPSEKEASQPEPPPRSELPKQEPGEFTRFFQTAKADGAKPVEPSRREERPSSPDFARTMVQRPNTPVPPRPPAPAQTPAQKGTEPGEFTRLFMQGGSFPVAPAPPPAPPEPARNLHRDPFASSPEDDIFSQPSSPSVPPSPAKKVGEFTELFGPRRDAPAPQQPSAVALPPRPVSDDPLSSGVPPVTPTPPPAPTPVRGPSEYTMVISGPGEIPPASSAPPPPARSAGAPPIAVPKPPSAYIPTPPLKIPPTPAVTPPKTQSKLVLLFIILGVLALLLVVLIVLILRK